MEESDSGQKEYQRLVVPDPTALENLVDEGSLRILSTQETLQSYELFIVEQWACSRQNPCAFIVTSNGHATGPINVAVLEIPRDPKDWPEILKHYMQVMLGAGSRARDTSLGMLLVSNLSNFPSTLSVIALPDPNTPQHVESFTVNENLKRLGCSGRTGFHLTPPSGATRAKFCQMYKINPDLPVQIAVVELVYACQTALAMFGCLDAFFIDGLFCDETYLAINTFWNTLGFSIYNVEPGDGILGPRTVASLLGLLLGSRNRLQTIGIPVPKDALEYESFKRGISQFQKQQRLTRSRRLDAKTVKRLHEVTQRAIAGETGFVPRAVKSTVAELSGKGGEMVLDIMKSRDKRAIADVETSELETFIENLSGATCKWLWRGKAPKAPFNHPKKFGRLLQSDAGMGNTSEAVLTPSSLQPLMKAPLSARTRFDNSGLEEQDPQAHHKILRGVAGMVKGAVSLPYNRVGGARNRGLSVKAETDPEDEVLHGRSMDPENLNVKSHRTHEEQRAGHRRQTNNLVYPLASNRTESAKSSHIYEQRNPFGTTFGGSNEKILAPNSQHPQTSPAQSRSTTWVHPRKFNRARSRSMGTISQMTDDLLQPAALRRSFSVKPFVHRPDYNDQSPIQDEKKYASSDAQYHSDLIDRTQVDLNERLPALSQAADRHFELLRSQLQTLSRVQNHFTQDIELERSKFQTNVQHGTALRSEAESDLQETMLELDAIFAKFEYEVNGMQAQVEASETVLEDFERQLTELERGVGGLHHQREEKPSWRSQVFALIERLSGI